MNAVASLILGDETGRIGHTQDLGDPLRLIVDAYQADTDADLEHFIVPREAEIIDRVTDGLGHADTLFERAVFYQDAKLIATETGEGIVLANQGMQGVGQTF